MNRKQYPQGQRKGLFKKAVALLALGLLLAGFCLNMTVSAAADDVNKVKDSIMVVQLAYESTSQGKIVISRGTGFLINDQHMLTCYHIFHITNEIEEQAKIVDGASYNRNKFIREAVVSGDVTIKMNVRKESVDSDFSILQLTEAINESVKKPVKLGNSDEGDGKSYTTQQVYALGFPEAVAQVQNTNTYTSADVTITDGKISKITSLSLWDSVNHEAQTQVIQHSARLTAGNSGGPLVNEDGAVLGVNKGANDNYNYTISINQIKVILDTLNIKYTAAGGSTTPKPTDPGTSDPVTPAQPADKSNLKDLIDEANAKVKDSKYDADSVNALKGVIDDANAVYSDSAATQSAVDSAADKLDRAIGNLKEKSGMDMTLIIIIAAVAVVIIIVIIIVVVMSKGKKQPVPARPNMGSAPGQAPFAPPTPPSPAPYNPGAPPVPPSPPSYGGNDGAGETSLLNEGAGETSVLGGGASGALVNVKGGQRVALNRSEFTIGKERRKVDFVIDNSSVSRTHAKIRIRAGEFFVLDLGSTNGTYVNGSKLTPNQETKLNNGDKIKISDEEFEFQG